LVIIFPVQIEAIANYKTATSRHNVANIPDPPAIQVFSGFLQIPEYRQHLQA
jgi:hypothetical protein